MLSKEVSKDKALDDVVLRSVWWGNTGAVELIFLELPRPSRSLSRNKTIPAHRTAFF
jgi:hypothetical protein